MAVLQFEKNWWASKKWISINHPKRINHLCYPIYPVEKTSNRAFLYGDGLFETIRRFKGEIPLGPLHFQRLSIGMDALGLKEGKGFSREKIIEEIENFCANQPQFDNCKIRLAVFRKGGAPYMPKTDEVDFVLEYSPLNTMLFEWKTPIGVGLFEQHYKNEHFLPSIKTSNALLYVLAAKYARDHGFGDALILNSKGNVVESSKSNIFIIKGDSLITPPLMDGPLSGICRTVITTMSTWLDFNFFEQSLDSQTLEQADEVFLTNSIEGIRSIDQFAEKSFRTDKTRKIFEALNEYISGLLKSSYY